VRYPAIYAKAAESFAGNFSLTGVEVRPSALSGTRKVVDCIFSYTNRNTDYTEKYFVRCDVTEEFPFFAALCAAKVLAGLMASSAKVNSADCRLVQGSRRVLRVALGSRDATLKCSPDLL
jgi:hypothetical protein